MMLQACGGTNFNMIPHRPNPLSIGENISTQKLSEEFWYPGFTQIYLQWEFQDPKMEVLYHIRPYFGGIFPYIGLKNRPYIW